MFSAGAAAATRQINRVVTKAARKTFDLFIVLSSLKMVNVQRVRFCQMLIIC